MTLPLSASKPFAKGGNRLCFVHPENPARCIKVRKPNFTLVDLRRTKGFPKNLRPLSSFDDNKEEYEVMKKLERRYGEALFQHVSRCFGMVETDMGKGIESELVRNADGRIAFSLKQQLFEVGLTPDLIAAIDQFCEFWESYCIPSRQLLPHNLVVQCNSDGSVKRLVAIDGLGDPTIIPLNWLPKMYQKHRFRQKTQQLRSRIATFIQEIDSGKHPSKVGKLKHDGTSQ
ncbi:MAG: YrbL family protein [Pseudomonadota bacterium]|nr:YrbL family protein [Pseudomonadota bacterium]